MHSYCLKLSSVFTAPCSCTIPTPAPKQQIAFTGTQPTTVSGLSAYASFNFSGDFVNEGQPFNVRYGHFIVPVSGIYGFSLTTYLQSRYYLEAEVVASYNSTEYQHLLHVKHGHYYDGSRVNRLFSMGTNYAIVNMTQGTEVWPRYVGGSGRLEGEGVPTFSGVLLYELWHR